MKRVAVVTGASGGMGREAAVALARRDWAILAVGGTNQAGLDATLHEIEQHGVACRGRLIDFRSSTATEDLLDCVASWTTEVEGQLRALVNLAGADVLTGRAAQDTFEQKLHALWQVDVLGTIRLSRVLGRHMQQHGGVIVNIGWDQADWGMEGDSGEFFGATKAAVMAFTRSLAKSLAPAVRVNCVAPGWIKTKWGDGASDRWQQRATRESLLKRWGTASDVARMICFLCADDSAFVNGQVIQVNGGFASHSEGPHEG